MKYFLIGGLIYKNVMSKGQDVPYIDLWERKMNYTYIVKCSDGTLYTGWTNNLDKRIACHNAGKGAKYTKSRCPVELVYFEEFNTKVEAMRREYEIKQMKREMKIQLIYKAAGK